MNHETARHHMIQQQLRTSEMLRTPIVDLLYTERRERYVPAAYRNLAFADIAIPLGPRASMLTPKQEARILHVADLQPGDRVLEVGTGSGHMAALMARQAQAVWTMEIDPGIAEQARANLAGDGIGNATVETGDGLTGLAAQAPYDFILMSGGVTEVPSVLQSQLKVGGKLLAFVGVAPVMSLRLITRPAEDVFVCKDLLETSVPYLQGAGPGPEFRF